MTERKRTHDQISTTVYNNDQSCEHLQCSNLAHYQLGDGYYCGVHARDKEKRVKLQNRSRQELQQQKKEQIVKMQKEQENARVKDMPGKVILYRLRMMKPPVIQKGYRPISPNAKGGLFTGAYRFLSLSPMKMGPIPPSLHHENQGPYGMKTVTCLENLHQGCKAFSGEAIQEKGNWVPTSDYLKSRDAVIYDSQPHRHKPSSQHQNQPLCSFQVRPDGSLRALTYIESRVRYCRLYEHFAKTSIEFAQLQTWHTQGYLIQICGFDAFDMDNVDKAFEDTQHPFGHERVLFTMLTVAEKDWPWHAEKWKKI
jgi:hypothetical protein